MKGFVRVTAGLTALLTACGSAVPSASELFFPTDPQLPNAVMEALFEGPLTVRHECVMIGRPRDLSIAIWPNGFTAERDDSGRLVVRDARGNAVAIEGQAFDMSGGYVAEFRPEGKVDSAAQQVRRVEEHLGYSIPDRCLGTDVYGVFLVGETHPLTYLLVLATRSEHGRLCFHRGMGRRCRHIVRDHPRVEPGLSSDLHSRGANARCGGFRGEGRPRPAGPAASGARSRTHLGVSGWASGTR